MTAFLRVVGARAFIGRVARSLARFFSLGGALVMRCSRSRLSSFSILTPFVLLAVVLAGCAGAERPAMSPTPVSPGYPSNGYAPPAEPTRDSAGVTATTTPAPNADPPAPPAPPTMHTESAPKSEASGKGFLDKIFGGDTDAKKAPAKVVAQAQPGPGGSGSSPPPPQPQQAPAQPQAVAPGTPVVKADPANELAPVRDLVIYTARFALAVYQVDQGLAAVEKIAQDNGGYLGQKKDREITIRIPRGRFQPTLVAIDKIGDVLHRDIQAQDVTDEHVDLEIRIKNARAMQKRLSDLLTKASVKDALEIEKELHRVTEELERLEGRIKVLKDKVAFSTVTVAFEPRGATIHTARVRLPFPWLGGLNLPSLLSLSEDK